MKKISTLISIFVSFISLTTVYATTNSSNASDIASVAVYVNHNPNLAPNDIVKSLNTFAFDLFDNASEPNKNTVLSPYSLSSLLGILMNGSVGKTHDEFVNIMHLNTNNNIVNFTTEMDKLNSSLMNSSTDLIIANALWADESLTYKKPFLDMMQKNKNINFFRVNFTHAPDQTKDKINSWVDTNTKGYIKSLLDQAPGVATKLILTNAIYFNGLWELPFKPNETRQRTFTKDDGTTKQLPMMNQQDTFLYTENNMLQLLQLSYKNSSLSIAILLPKTNYKLQQIRLAMNSSKFAELLQSVYYNSVNVTLPKFKIDSTFDSLVKSLRALGLTTAFNNDADFSNITKDKLIISEVIQKAVIQVDEKGTVAAAASGMVMFGSSGAQTPINFKANHPFLFIIFDKQSGLILFVGQMIG